jgi:hypothetical protein
MLDHHGRMVDRGMDRMSGKERGGQRAGSAKAKPCGFGETYATRRRSLQPRMISARPTSAVGWGEPVCAS